MHHLSISICICVLTHLTGNKYKFNTTMGTKEIVQQLRELVALSEDLSWFLNTHIEAKRHL